LEPTYWPESISAEDGTGALVRSTREEPAIGP
jgi:hypothetical protein